MLEWLNGSESIVIMTVRRNHDDKSHYSISDASEMTTSMLA